MSTPLTTRQKINSCLTFLWNHKEKKFLDRGARSWAGVSFFYLIFYSALFGFFYGTLAIFFQMLDKDVPYLTGDSSLLRNNPGMGFQPMPDIENTLIRFRLEQSSYKSYVSSISKILKPYKDAWEAGKGVDCSNMTDANHGPSDVACRVNYAELTSECNEGNNYGYGAEKKPCVLLKLNKIFDWMPTSYSEKNMRGSGMTEAMRAQYLQNPKWIWVECLGENSADVDNLGGNITYHPRQGFPFYFYPYQKQQDYLSPLVFVKFNTIHQNVALMIECRALARNIDYDRSEKEGGVHFELLVDP